MCLSVNGRKMIKINKRLLSSLKRRTRKQFKDFARSLTRSLGRMIYLLSLVFLYWWPALQVCVCVWFNCCLSDATFRDVLLATCNCANKFTWHWTVLGLACSLTWARAREREWDARRTTHANWQLVQHYWKIDETFRVACSTTTTLT